VQRVCLTAVPEERQHELTPEPFVQRVPLDPDPQVRDDIAVPAGRQPDLGEVFERSQPLLLEPPHDLHQSAADDWDSLQSRPAPQRQRSIQPVARVGEITPVLSCTTFRDQLFEGEHVDIVQRGLKHVPPRITADRARSGIGLSEQTTQQPHVGLEIPSGGLGRLRVP
jgi:hypothetical protein